MTDSRMNSEVEILHLYVSPGHNYLGHHGGPAGTHPVIEVPELECIAGQGIRGDRFFGFREDYKGQITFFALETYRALCEQFHLWRKPPGVFRRNVVTSHLDLNALIDVEFEIHGIRFVGTEECKPCYWMNQAFHPGAEAAMQGRGGLRARILTSGILRIGRGVASVESVLAERA